MVKIITDITSVLSPEITKKYNIPVIPQVIIFDEKSYYEGVDIDIDTFMQKLKTTKLLPKTAAPPPELFIREFTRLVPLGEPILCIHPSSDLSGTVSSATLAAREFPEADIRVIDTRLIASPMATLIELVAKWADEGLDIDTLEKRVVTLSKNCRIYFLVSTLEYLARGGRIGGASALLGSVLQIKPILKLENGKVNTFEKERTHKRALERMKQVVLDELPPENYGYITIMHADASEEAICIAKEFQSKLGIEKVPKFHMPPAIVTHDGPGILGIGYYIGDILY